MRLRGSEPEEGLRLVEESLQIDDDPVAHVLRAELLSELGREAEARRELDNLMRRIEGMAVKVVPDYQLSWLESAAESTGRDDLVEKLASERARRAQRRDATPRSDDSRLLPVRENM